MEKIIPSFQFKTFSKAENKNAYRLYRAALEWNLVDPIVIESPDDFKSKPEWYDRLEPYHHQANNLITFCRRLPVTLLADDVGLGKTISAGLVMSELISRNRISKILVVCPKILIPQWGEELNTKFGIDHVEAEGSKILDVKLHSDEGAKITTYQTAMKNLDRFAEDGYQMLILDEAHKLRNLYGTSKSPQVALCFQKALRERMFKYVLMLTATPIHNRLWDIYSLIDLLAVARGHENPFGGEGVFARNYILDRRDQARKLVPEKKDEFRDIVYKYMYRTKRADVRLYFPDRKIQVHKVKPTPEEKQLIETIAKPIQTMHPLTQVSLLQALVSSPEAFYAQLKTMGRHGTIDHEIVRTVGGIVKAIDCSAKLDGLKSLIGELKKEQGENWRMVIFTERLETQSTIEIFLDKLGVLCGIINGSTTSKNQDTLKKFRNKIPEINVIISTRAGSEGMNLQVSNILVNYDLPWNPMIVEQRIGRIQRLASDHKNVVIFNMILQGTFEEYIVGRLMEKLQMVSSAIGDIEALLDVAGVNEEMDFGEKIRQLVVDSLAGKDVKKATEQIDKSIEEARKLLDAEEENMNILLGSSSEVVGSGPICPKLPPIERSMEIKEFTLAALDTLNVNIEKCEKDRYLIKLEGKNQKISFRENEDDERYVTCRSGIPFFERLVTNLTNNPLHLVRDIDANNINSSSKELVHNWTTGFDGKFISSEINKFQMCFSGKALLRVNITVAHDSYERLLEIDCNSKSEFSNDVSLSESMGKYLKDPKMLGLSVDYFSNKILDDEAVFEFCRFYQERLTEELKYVGNDTVKKKKIEDDFTPNTEIALVGLEGEIYRNVEVNVSYNINSDEVYNNFLLVTPKFNKIISRPEIKTCDETRVKAPINCFDTCGVSKKYVLKYLLKKSEVSSKVAMEKYFTVCTLTGKNILKDEAQISDITGKNVASKFLKISAISGKKGEPEFFEKCQFTNIDVLKDELSSSQISGKKYRIDQERISSVSGKRGHEQEFIICSEKGLPILLDEAEKCEITGKLVSPGVLEECVISNKRVVPSELLKSSISGKMALKKYLIHSSLSDALILEDEAIRSNDGLFCTPTESKECAWSNKKCHPSDLTIDSLTGLPVHFRFVEKDKKNSLRVLIDLLDGGKINNDVSNLGEKIINTICQSINNSNCIIESFEYSPNRNNIAICAKVKKLLGLKIRYDGLIFSTSKNAILGNIAIGKRNKNIWINSK